jgi:hypothetical protein
MTAIRQDAIARYSAMDLQHQLMFLTRLASWLTLVGRDTYDRQGGVADGARLRTVNEVQNRISSQLLKMLKDDRRRYPDDVFANIIVDYLQELKIRPEDVFQWN